MKNHSTGAIEKAGHYDTRASAFRLYPDLGKRVLDIALSLLLLPVVILAIVVVWVLMRASGDNGPLFFGHRRIGKNGRVFKCWKLRTMVMDAERKLRDHLRENPAAAAEWARDHKLDNDPRITHLGKFLRKTSLDELPQLWNVMTGEMSLVGPRPVVRTEMHKYGIYRLAYMSVRPGVTGLWQVSGRNDTSYDERVQLDVTYVRDTRLWTDLSVIFQTAAAVLNRTGK